MEKRRMLDHQIERLEREIAENKEHLAKTLKSVAKNFEHTASQIDSGSEHWFNDADYVEHNCNWIKEYSIRIAKFEHDLKMLKDVRSFIFED